MSLRPTSLVALLMACVAAGAPATTDAAERNAVSLTAPEDGGCPRDPSRIVPQGENSFLIRAGVEEGQGFLKHAVSRVDLICSNSTDKPAEITLNLELSEDGRRTDFDANEFGGMPLRDFLFIQKPGEGWQQVHGRTSDWTSVIRFTAPPGETKVGLSPWYTYGDYLAFIQSLTEQPILAKERIGLSDQGREHWEIVITDPEAPRAEKKVIFWQAREHAYETFSSFAMEGLIPYLTSPAAASARKDYIFVLHPMTNVDGVAQGYEYRGGYDYPEPRGTGTGRLTFETIDRLKPDYAIAWHNWIAPRDADVLFYTGADPGPPTRRPWDLFTQRFLSPRAAGHHWLNETVPARYNWKGRELSDGNVHEYAMKHYDTRIWGWEMPWWGRSIEDAKRCGASYAAALIGTLHELQESPQPIIDSPMVEVPCWSVHEFAASGKAHVDNLFRDAALIGEFTSPSGKTITVEGFYDGDNTWRLRFSPNEEGKWTYLLRGEGFEHLSRGALNCLKPTGSAFIGIHPENPYAFARGDGSPFFPMGDTCYGLFDDSPITPELRAEYLQTRRRQSFNFVRLTIGHSPLQASQKPEEFWAWGGTPDRPVFDEFNPRFFQRFDALLTQMQAAGMNAELILCNLYRFPFNDPAVWTGQRERQWLRYVVSRYGAFNNVFMWTVANEYEQHPDGQYRLDDPADPLWAKQVARIIKSHDPYHHPVTVHPVISASRRGESPRSGYDAPWRIGEFFGDDTAIDVLSQQTGQAGEGTSWDDNQNCWIGDSPDVAASIKADRKYHRPVINTESGYEYQRGGPTENQQVHHTDKVRRTAWRIVAAGGYFAAGFNGTLAHSDIWNTLDPTGHYTFAVADEGAGDQLSHLYRCLTSLPYGQMQPFSKVTGEMVGALGLSQQCYLVYLPHGGNASIDLSNDAGIEYQAEWLNPRTGVVERTAKLAGGVDQRLVAPDSWDWSVVIRRPPESLDEH